MPIFFLPGVTFRHVCSLVPSTYYICAEPIDFSDSLQRRSVHRQPRIGQNPMHMSTTEYSLRWKATENTQQIKMIRRKAPCFAMKSHKCLSSLANQKQKVRISSLLTSAKSSCASRTGPRWYCVLCTLYAGASRSSASLFLFELSSTASPWQLSSARTRRR